MNVSIRHTTPIATLTSHELKSGMVVVPVPPKAIDQARGVKPWYSLSLTVPRIISEVRVDRIGNPHRLVQFMAGNQLVICGANREWYQIK